MSPDTLFTNIRIVADGVDLQGDLLVRNGAILDFGHALGRPDQATIIDSEGAVLCPGLVDMRAALGEPGYEYRETIASAAQAAAAGGSPPWRRCPIQRRRSTTRRWCICCAPAGKRPAA